MHYKKILIYALLSPLLFLSGQNYQFFNEADRYELQEVREYRVVVKIIGDEWRVVLEGDASKSDVTLRRGDRIRWVVEGSDASFAFPDSRIFGQETRNVRNGNPLVMAVSANSPSGTFAYTVFVHESMTYARGQSPPRIIVQD